MKRESQRSNTHRSRGHIALILALSAVVVVASTSCSSTARKGNGIPANAYPWKLMPPSTLGKDVMWRQKIGALFGKREISFSAVVQKRGDELTVLGLGPANSKAFVLKLVGSRVSFRSWMPRKLPFPPRFILIDIQRAFFSMGLPNTPGKHTLARDGERVFEHRSASNQLIERRFERLDGKHKGSITIRYADPSGPNAPADVIVDNKWFGYIMKIETVEATAL